MSSGAIETAGNEVSMVEKSRERIEKEGIMGGLAEGNIMREVMEVVSDGVRFDSEGAHVSSPLVDASRLDKPGLSLSPEAGGDETIRARARLLDGNTGCLCLVSDLADATPVTTPISTSGNDGVGAVGVESLTGK